MQLYKQKKLNRYNFKVNYTFKNNNIDMSIGLYLLLIFIVIDSFENNKNNFN